MTGPLKMETVCSFEQSFSCILDLFNFHLVLHFNYRAMVTQNSPYLGLLFTFAYKVDVISDSLQHCEFHVKDRDFQFLELNFAARPSTF